MTIKKYTEEFLFNILKRDDASLVGNYPVLNSKTSIEFKCNCGEAGKKSFCILPNIGAFCRKCTLSKMVEKNKLISLEKYGCENPFQNEEIKQKIKDKYLEKYGETSAMKNDDVKLKLKNKIIEKYGVDNASKNSEVKKKIRATFKEKYGVEHALQNREIREKFKKTMLDRYNVDVPYHNIDIKNKGEQTNIIKYGVAYSLQNPLIRDKAVQTCMRRYGVSNSLKSKIIREKINKTCKEKYGTTNPFQAECCKEKIRSTNIQKYGVENVSQNPEIFEKAQKNGYRFKEYKMPSGAIRFVQGYEPFALDELIKIYKEEQIETCRQNIPRICYRYNNKVKYHFPDIYIPHENKLIEVKSTWTYKKDREIINAKELGAISEGYNYEIWVYDCKGKKVHV